MRVSLTGRNVEITTRLRADVRKRLLRAETVVGEISRAEVVLTVQRYRRIAEVAIRSVRGALTAEAWSRDMQRSIAKAIERVETQVHKRYRKKLTGKRRAGSRERAARRAVARVGARTGTEPAVARIVEESLDRVKPITVEEAILLLEDTRRPFVAFRDSSSGGIGIVYRRRDGRHGLIQPRP